MGTAFATFAPLRGAMAGDDDSCRRRRVRGRPCLRRPALASPSRRCHGARDRVGRRPPAGRIPANVRGHARRRACARCGAPACVWAFDLGESCHLCGMVHSGLRFVVEAWASYQILAACELRRQGLTVARAFSKGGLVAAREAVGLIVGRDTSVLDEQGVARAAVETVAENASDGVIAPLFYLYDRGCALGCGVQGGERAGRHGGLQKRALHRLRLRLGAPRRCGELDSLRAHRPCS